jgi:hypothetical protein
MVDSCTIVLVVASPLIPAPLQKGGRNLYSNCTKNSHCTLDRLVDTPSSGGLKDRWLFQNTRNFDLKWPTIFNEQNEGEAT